MFLQDMNIYGRVTIIRKVLRNYYMHAFICVVHFVDMHESQCDVDIRNINIIITIF